MELIEGRFKFNFSDAIDAFKFDETNCGSLHYHGLSHCMKSVDFVIEFADVWVFVEVKDFMRPNQSSPTCLRSVTQRDTLVNDLVIKYRDTFLYRWAEGKVEKPVQYICLIEIESALVSPLMGILQRQLPVIEQANYRWCRGIAQSAVVVNIATWNASFSDWPVTIV